MASTDIAELGVKVTPKGVKETARELSKLTKEGKDVERGMSKMEGIAQRWGSGMAGHAAKVGRSFKSGFSAASRSIKSFGNRIQSFAASAKRQLSKVSSAVEGFKSKFGGLKGLLAGAGIAAAATAFGALGTKIVQTGSQFQTLGIQMQAVTGSAEAADQATAWIKDFTLNTPYQLDQVSGAFIKLKSFGLDPMSGAMQAVADMTSFLGGSMETMDSIVLALGKGFTKGRLQAEELNMMAERGVPVFKLLSEQLGVAESAIFKMSERGELGRDAIEALIAGMQDLAGGSSQALMDTFAGKWSNLQDQISNALNIIAQGGLLDGVTDAISRIIEGIDRLAKGGQLEEWGQRIGKAFEVIVVSGETTFAALSDALESYKAGALAVWGETSAAYKQSTIEMWEFVGETIGQIPEAFELIVNLAITGILKMIKWTKTFYADVLELTQATTMGVKQFWLDLTGVVAKGLRVVQVAATAAIALTPGAGVAADLTGLDDAVSQLTVGVAALEEESQKSSKALSSFDKKIKDLRASAGDTQVVIAGMEEQLAANWEALQKNKTGAEELAEANEELADKTDDAKDASKKFSDAAKNQFSAANKKLEELSESAADYIQNAKIAQNATENLSERVNRLNSQTPIRIIDDDSLRADDLIPDPSRLAGKFDPVWAKAGTSLAKSITDAFEAALTGGDVGAVVTGFFQDMGNQGLDTFQGFLEEAFAGGIRDERGQVMPFMDALFDSEQGKQAWRGAGQAVGAAILDHAQQKQSVWQGIVGGAISGFATTGTWQGAVIGAIVGGISAALSDADTPSTRVQYSAAQGFMFKGRKQDLQEMDLERAAAKANAAYRSWASAYRDVLQLFGDAELFDFIDRLPGLTSDILGWMEGSITEVLGYLDEIKLPELFFKTFAAAIQEGFDRLSQDFIINPFDERVIGFDASVLERVFDEIAKLPGEQRLNALATFIETAVSVVRLINEADFDAIQAASRLDSTQQFIQGLDAFGEQIELRLAGLDQLDFIDRATEINEVVRLFQQAGQGLQQFITQIETLRDNLSRSIQSQREQLLLGGMSDLQQQEFLLDKYQTLRQQLEQATSQEEIQLLTGQIQGVLSQLAGVVDLEEGSRGNLATGFYGPTWREFLADQLQSLDELQAERLGVIIDQAQTKWDSLYEQILRAAELLGLFGDTVEDLIQSTTSLRGSGPNKPGGLQIETENPDGLVKPGKSLVSSSIKVPNLAITVSAPAVNVTPPVVQVNVQVTRDGRATATTNIIARKPIG